MMKNNVMNLVRRGEVWLADLRSGVKGSEQGGVRPVLIVSNDKNNVHSTTITVVPLTSKKNKNRIPTHIMLENEPYLTEISVALVEQIRTIDKVRLIEKMGNASEYIMIEIDKAIEIQTATQKQFSYDKALQILKQIRNLKKEIMELGKRRRLVEAFNYEVNRFKEYCTDYNMDYQQVQQQVRSALASDKLKEVL